MRLAGTYHPIPYLIERITDFLPGVSEVSAIWIDYDKNIYSSNENTPLNEYLKVQAQSLRNTKLITAWDESLLIFSETKKVTNQLSLEDEEKLNVLKLYFSSPIDKYKDIILIKFPEHAFLKSLNKTFKGITTQEKNILTNLLSSIFSAEHKRVLNERNLLKSIEHINTKKDQRLKQLSEDLKSTEQLYSSSIRGIINNFKVKLEDHLKKNFIIQNEVIYKLAKEKLNIETIEKVINQAIYLAYNLNSFEENIQITSDHIQIDQNTIETKSTTIQHSNNKSKTAELLDRYEAAAIKSINHGLNVNGKNVASRLDPPVTPPAITDAIKKKQAKISYLLSQYPERWKNIRKAIRPISVLDKNRSVVNRVS